MEEYYKSEEIEKLPEYVYGCTEKDFRRDVDLVLNRELNDLYEDACDDVVNKEGLEKFLDEWSKKQIIKTFVPDYLIVIILKN